MSSFEDLDPNLSESSVISTDEIVATEEPVGITETKKDKDGIEVPALPKFNIYIGMQLIGLLALSLACFLMYRELATYNFEDKVPPGTIPPPRTATTAPAAPRPAAPAAAAPAAASTETEPAAAPTATPSASASATDPASTPPPATPVPPTTPPTP